MGIIWFLLWKMAKFGLEKNENFDLKWSTYIRLTGQSINFK